MKRTALVLLIAVLALALAGCGGKQAGLPESVAKVDGKPITGSTYYQILSSSFGRQVLPALVEQQIMLNWAEKEGVPVTDAQLDKQIASLKRDGNYDDQVESAGGEQAVRDRIRDMQARMNLGEKFNKFTDAELESMYDTMKQRYVHGAQKRLTVIVTTDAKKIAEAEKAIKGGMEFDAAAVKFSDPQFVMGGPAKTPIEKGKGPKGLWEAVENVKIGEVSKPFSFELPQFGKLQGLAKVTGDQPKLDIKFKEAKDEVRGMAAMQKTMDPGFQKKLEAQKKKADIVIELPQYKYLVDQIKNPAPQMGMPMMPPGARPGAGR